MENRHNVTLLWVAYNGRFFHGAAKQPNVYTVLDVIERFLRKRLGRRVDCKILSRTDKYVSAMQNIVVIRDVIRPPPFNSKDLCFIAYTHPQNSVKIVGKVYKYFFREKIRKNSDVRMFLKYITSLRDFSKFSTSKVRKECIVYYANVCDINSSLYRGSVFTIFANRFLYRMVRCLAYVVKKLSEGVWTFDNIVDYVEGKLELKVHPLPPENLVLWRYVFDRELEWLPLCSKAYSLDNDPFSNPEAFMQDR